MERLGFHNVVLESLDLILEPPGTNFEDSGGCFGIPNDYLGATNMRGNHHIYPVASPVDYRRSGPGGMRVAIKSAVPLRRARRRSKNLSELQGGLPPPPLR